MSQPSILIIEDEQDIRESLQELLEIEGFPILTAGNGKEGLESVALHPEIRLILLDLMMPVMNGFEFLERLQATHPGVLERSPIVIFSAAGRAAEDRIDPKFEVIKKPIEIDQLLAIVRKHCSG